MLLTNVIVNVFLSSKLNVLFYYLTLVGTN